MLSPRWLLRALKVLTLVETVPRETYGLAASYHDFSPLNQSPLRSRVNIQKDEEDPKVALTLADLN